jgi:hypothetical protein
LWTSVWERTRLSSEEKKFLTVMLVLSKTTKCVKCSSCVLVHFCCFVYTLANGMFACGQNCQRIPLFTMKFLHGNNVKMSNLQIFKMECVPLGIGSKVGFVLLDL